MSDGNDREVIAEFEFDAFLANEPGRVSVVDHGNGWATTTSVVVCVSGTETRIASACRDHWATDVHVGGSRVCQEDSTRNYLDAVIKALTVLRDYVTPLALSPAATVAVAPTFYEEQGNDNQG